MIRLMGELSRRMETRFDGISKEVAEAKSQAIKRTKPTDHMARDCI